MVRILETRREVCPPLKLTGRRYTDADRDAGGSFSAQWGAVASKQLVRSPGARRHRRLFIIAMWEPCASPRQALNTGLAFSWLQRPLCPKVMRRWRFRQEIWGVCFLYGKDSSPDLFGMDAHKACVAAWQEQGLDSLRLVSGAIQLPPLHGAGRKGQCNPGLLRLFASHFKE